MGTTAHLLAHGADPARLAASLDAALTRLADLERRWTRFRDDSELSQVNAARGAPVVISPDTVAVLALALEAWSATGGRFDPTLLDEVVAAGYDRPWPLAAAGPGRTDHPSHHEAVEVVRPSPGSLLVSPEAGVVVAPPGLHLDLGAIGKGRAADLLVADLVAAGATGAVVNIGGDLALSGVDEGDQPFVVDVEDPDTQQPRWRLQLAAGGVATSGVRRRRWRTATGPAHHVIDPLTGRSATSDLVAATVVAGTAAWAEVLATAAIVGGRAAATELMRRLGVAALLVDIDGDAVAVGGWAAFDRGLVPEVEPAGADPEAALAVVGAQRSER